MYHCDYMIKLETQIPWLLGSENTNPANSPEVIRNDDIKNHIYRT